MKDILITSSVLILALLVIRLVFKKVLSRRLQYALWALVLVRLLVPVNLPAVHFSVLTAAEPIQAVVSERLEQVVRPTRPVTDVPTIPSAQWPLDHVKQEVPPLQWDQTVYPATYYPSPADHPKSGMTAGELLALVWQVGIALMGVFFLLSNLWFWLRLRRCRKVWDAMPYGVSRKVYLVPEGVIPSPCLFLNAIYLTPAALRSEESLRHVLTHEETHARHLDPLWSLLRCLCLAIYWFDPLVWAAAACAKTDCELACDEAVLKKLGEGERISYGQTLLSLIPAKRLSNPLLSATTMTAGKRQLKDRITRIAQNPRQLAVAVAAVAILALTVSACTFAGGETARDPEPTPTPVESQKPATPIFLPIWEPEATIPLSGLAPYAAPAVKVTPYSNHYFDDWKTCYDNKDIDGHHVMVYSSEGRMIYAAYEENDVYYVFQSGLYEEYTNISYYEDLWGHHGFYLDYFGRYSEHPYVSYVPTRDYYYFTEDGVLTLLARCRTSYWEEPYQIDWDGDGTDEFIAPWQLFFMRDGVVYEAQLDELLLNACPELSSWDFSDWDKVGKYLYAQGESEPRNEINGRHWGRYLYFDGENLLFYKDQRSTIDHILEGIDDGVPAEVVAAVKECTEKIYKASQTPTVPEPEGETYALGYPAVWDDWRVMSFYGPYNYTFGDVTVEAWGFIPQLHTTTPDEVIRAEGTYLDEDNWVSAAASRNTVVFRKEYDGTLTFLWDNYRSEPLDSQDARDRIFQKLMELRPGLVSANSSTSEYSFELVGVPGDNAYHVLADSNGNTSFELTAETFVALWGTWTPSFAAIQVRLEPEDGSPVTEATLAVNDVSTVTIPTTGRYQIKVATGPDEIEGGTLVLLDAPAGTVWSWGGNTYGQLGDGTLPGRGSGGPALEVQNDLALIMDSGGNMIFHLNTAEGEMGEDYFVSPDLGNSRSRQAQFADPENFLWSRADFGPQDTDGKACLILMDSARQQFLLFFEGSDLVGSLHRDRGTVYYRAEPAQADGQDVFSFMLDWYERIKYHVDWVRAELNAAQKAGITMEQVDALIDRGYIPEEIGEMTPEQVDSILTKDLDEAEKAAYYRAKEGSVWTWGSNSTPATESKRVRVIFSDSSTPTTTHAFYLNGIPGDNTYQVLTNSSNETVFELVAGTTVTFVSLLEDPDSVNLQLRLELEGGSAAVEEALTLNGRLEMTIPVTGRYQVKVAATEEIIDGTLILFVPSPVPELKWPEDFPSSMYQSIQIIENESYYAYLGAVRGLPHNGRDFYLSVAYKDSEREQWYYRDGDKTIDGARIHPPEYIRITFGDEPNILRAFGESGEKLVELDLETQEILWQYEIDENSPPNEPAHIKS